MRTIIFVAMIGMLCGENTDSVLIDFLSSMDQKFQSKRSFSYGPIEQPYFGNVTFLSIDTFVTFIHPKPVSEVPLRIAIAKDGNVYRLFGFDKSEYNDLVSDAPVALKAEEARPYGEFFLDVTELWGPFGYTFIFNTEAFIAENRRRMVRARSGVVGYDCDNAHTWDELEGQIRAMFADFKWGAVLWNESDSVYEAEYIAWMETTGALRRFKLLIHPDGKCDKVEDSVWSESFGYYYKYQE